MSPKEYFDLLVKTSQAGGFPAIISDAHGSYAGCRYRADNGRQCAIGLLLPDAEAMEADENVGPVENRFQFFEPHLPEWMTEPVAKAIQATHDCLGFSCRNGDWEHEEFVAALRKIPIFKDF